MTPDAMARNHPESRRARGRDDAEEHPAESIPTAFDPEDAADRPAHAAPA